MRITLTELCAKSNIIDPSALLKIPDNLDTCNIPVCFAEIENSELILSELKNILKLEQNRRLAKTTVQTADIKKTARIRKDKRSFSEKGTKTTKNIKFNRNGRGHIRCVLFIYNKTRINS